MDNPNLANMECDAEQRHAEKAIKRQRASVRNTALGLLARREHSRRELQQKLIQKFSADSRQLIAAALDLLIEQGLLSDERFTEAYVNMRARKGYGPERIAQELSEKGIEVEMASRYLEAGTDWQELLKQTWQKKFNRLPLDFQEKAKQMRFLHYRGYSADTINRLFEQF